MNRHAVTFLVLALAACGLDVTGSLEVAPGEPDGGRAGEDGATSVTDANPPDAEEASADSSTDGPLPDGPPFDAGPDVITIGPSFCQEASLAACYRFEDSIVDESAPAVAAPTTATNVTYVTSRPGHGKALRVQNNTVVHLPDDSSWDTTNATVEFWVNIETLPATGSRGGIFDNQRNYAVFIMPNGVARCGTANLDSTVLPLKTWTHVACTWNAATTTVTVYVNGQMTGSVVSANMPIASSDPAAIGSNLPSGEYLDGMIDGLRIFRVLRTPAQIAAAAQ